VRAALQGNNGASGQGGRDRKIERGARSEYIHVRIVGLTEAEGPMEIGMIAGAIALLLLAFGLVAAELFVPSHGVLTAFAALAAVASVWLAYNQMPGLGLVFAVVLLVATPVVFYMAIKIYPTTAVGKKVLLNNPVAAAGFEEETAQLEALVGKQGVALSFLRPAGAIEIEGKRIDAMAESDMIAAGARVEVMKVSGLKVIVKAV
jgi:membrane-bound ClpP family serine protease